MLYQTWLSRSVTRGPPFGLFWVKLFFFTHHFGELVLLVIPNKNNLLFSPKAQDLCMITDNLLIAVLPPALGLQVTPYLPPGVTITATVTTTDKVSQHQHNI